MLKPNVKAKGKDKDITPLPPRKRPTNNKKTLFEIAKTYLDFGVGQKLTRSIWRRPECYWTITRVMPTVMIPRVRPRGKAWGILTWRGVPEAVERKVRGSSKREWQHYNLKWYDQFKNAEKWIQNQALIGGSPPLPIVLQDPTKIPVLEQRFRTVYAEDADYKEAVKRSRHIDQKVMFKLQTPKTEVLFHYPHKKKR